MNCRNFQDELPEIVLTQGAVPSPGAVAHMKQCPPCAEEYLSFQKTFTMLETWTAPEPTPYFNQKLAVRLREEQAAPRMGWFESLTTRLRFNTGRNFRPAVAGALALALVVGGGSLFEFNPSQTAPTPHISAAVNDLEIIDRNEQAFQQMDALQQTDDTGSQNSDEGAQVTVPSS